jgi:hypothetical protein
MNNKPPFKVKALYLFLYFLMDVESALWDIAEFLIKPTALLRRWIAYRISLLVLKK